MDYRGSLQSGFLWGEVFYIILLAPGLGCDLPGSVGKN